MPLVKERTWNFSGELSDFYMNTAGPSYVAIHPVLHDSLLGFYLTLKYNELTIKLFTLQVV